MSLILLNSKSNQQIPLDKESPLIIGRNNILGCLDKKVSRNHGKITCLENGIRLVALHTNPCFFMKKGIPPICQLNKDEGETLNEGDWLGLLPNSFWFQVLSSSDPQLKIKEEKIEESSSSKTDTVENVSAANTPERKKTESTEYSKRIGSPEFEKTKRLPLWIYNTDETDKLTSDAAKRLKLDTDCNTTKPNLDACEDRIKEEPSTSRVRLDETLDSGTNDPNETNDSGNKEFDLEKAKSSKRPICQYDKNCFRKNAQHKADFCHPGDSDYIPYEKRPLCEYGEACYRKNERHKVEFRHVRGGSPSSPVASPSPRSPGPVASSPLPPKRRRKTVKQSSEYEDDDDEFDVEEPFADDASSDEYVPSDLNSEEDLNESRELL